MIFRILLITGFLLSCCLLITNCKSAPSPQDKLYDEVMEIHDAVMPEMSTIHRLRKALKTIDTVTDTTIDIRTISYHRQQLDKADEAMMSWMASFKNPTADEAPQTAITYLENEKKQITEVRDLMLNSIAAAKKVIDQADLNNEKMKK